MLKLIHALDMDFDYVKDYYDAFEDKWIDLNCYALFTIRDGIDKYFNYIKTNEKNLYYLVDDDNPNYIIGYGSIDFQNNYKMSNINYGIRPNERNKGYGTNLLKLLLSKCEEFGMSEVYILCKKSNIASQQVILNNNGVFEEEFTDDFEGLGVKYWI